MEHFLAVVLSFPSVVYTVLLGAALVYWVFVMVGAARIELLGEGAADGAADGALDGAADGAVDGAAKGALDGLGDGADGHGHADVGDGDAGGAEGHDAHVHHGGLAGIIAALKLRSAPATVVLSLLVLFSWLFCVMGMQAALRVLPEGALVYAKAAAFLGAPLLALPFTSLAVRPLARIFVPPKAAAKTDLIGKVCTIRTGKVTDRFGEAVLDDGGAGLVVRVRVDTGEALSRGDQAVIVGYDEQSQEFTVAPMEDLLGEEEPPRRRARR